MGFTIELLDRELRSCQAISPTLQKEQWHNSFGSIGSPPRYPEPRPRLHGSACRFARPALSSHDNMFPCPQSRGNKTGDFLRIERNPGGQPTPAPGIETRSITIETDGSGDDIEPSSRSSSSSSSGVSSISSSVDVVDGATNPWKIRASTCEGDDSNIDVSSDRDGGSGIGSGSEFSSSGEGGRAGDNGGVDQEQGMVLFNVAEGTRLHVRWEIRAVKYAPQLCSRGYRQSKPTISQMDYADFVRVCSFSVSS